MMIEISKEFPCCYCGKLVALPIENKPIRPHHWPCYVKAQEKARQLRTETK